MGSYYNKKNIKIDYTVYAVTNNKLRYEKYNCKFK